MICTLIFSVRNKMRPACVAPQLICFACRLATHQRMRVNLASRISLVAKMFLLALLLISPQLLWAQAEPVRGVYGVPSPGKQALRALLPSTQVNAVFAPPDQAAIAYYKAAGLQVYLSFNVFGGAEPWKQYPDSIPLTASGAAIDAKLGGVCPTHPQWRQQRLALFKSWVEQFGGGASAIDGIWLDFIRYPGRWEQQNPELPDTCYCRRCLSFFQAEHSISLPKDADAAAAAAWIQQHAAREWRQWKQEQINSFAREARLIVKEAGLAGKLKLGVFLVPWRQGERQGQALTLLAQDAEALAQYADILSPMLYHRMVGKPISWIKEMTEYFSAMSPAQGALWPIVQAEETGGEEFGRAIEAASQGGAQGLLVYSFADMRPELWPQLARFEPARNLLRNAAFEEMEPGQAASPKYWRRLPSDPVHGSSYFITAASGRKTGELGLRLGLDGQGAWQTIPLPCQPGKSYQFSAEFLRQQVSDAYPEIVMWGQSVILNTHRLAGAFQPLQVELNCPANAKPEQEQFLFRATASGEPFWMRDPKLVQKEIDPPSAHPIPQHDFFPIGAYGASLNNLDRMQALGLNSAVLPLNPDSVAACLRQNMHCLLGTPHDINALLSALNSTAASINAHPELFAFYVNDEPEIHSFPAWKARDIFLLLRERCPRIQSAMAIVRPWAIVPYKNAADFFMLDQYPIPFMPLSWLSSSMDLAASHVGDKRLYSVIQAFGGEKWRSAGWPRLPSFEEMNCLAFLSIIHGSRGIYFFIFPEITATLQSTAAFHQVLNRLNQALPWLGEENISKAVRVEMESVNRVDPTGQAAVHCCMKEKDGGYLLLCVNTIGHEVKARLHLSQVGGRRMWRDIVDGSERIAVNDSLLVDFAPYSVKLWTDAAQPAH